MDIAQQAYTVAKSILCCDAACSQISLSSHVCILTDTADMQRTVFASISQEMLSTNHRVIPDNINLEHTECVFQIYII